MIIKILLIGGEFFEKCIFTKEALFFGRLPLALYDYLDSVYLLKLSKIDCQPLRCNSMEFSFSASKVSFTFVSSPFFEKNTSTCLQSDIVKEMNS